MTAQATGTFTVSGWDENTCEELDGGGKLTRAHVTFGFDGDLKGKGGWEAVMCYGQDGTASFTGYQRTVGELAGRSGSFVVRADGSYEDGQARTLWQVVDGSATGDLRGLRGTGSAVTTGGSGGTFTFDYEIG
ncbi:MAG TPA: DUF3224 domain-containing protein [Streptosporangiaceae bacterium]|nr:DUF3224 domain-containing protein [Streptosporangiaceae bacterium]